MSSVKFYILGGGRWRELDTSAGRVEGWGSAHFLHVDRGRLSAVRRAPVLRGLRSLAAGRALTVHDGAPLSQIRCSKTVKDKQSPCLLSERRVFCQHMDYGCRKNVHFNMQLQSGEQHPVHVVNAAVQADLLQELPNHQDSASTTLGQKPRVPEPKILYNQQSNKINKKLPVKKKQRETIVPHKNNVSLNSSDDDLSTSIMKWNRKRKMRDISGAELCKELIIMEEDIMLLRNFIEKDEKNVFKVDLKRFDADDNYKSKLFYKLNPLVNVERCKAIADMTWERRSQSTVTLKDFITNLGLRQVEDPLPSRPSYKMRKRCETRKSRESMSEQDKENLESKRQPKANKHPHKVLGESVGAKPNSDRAKVKVKVNEVSEVRVTRRSQLADESMVVEVSDSDFESTEAEAPNKRAAEGGGREYCPAEDASIVRWLRAAGRGHLVNGNRLWRELQPVHHRLTGHFRSWHSLRNRYLRYVLPSLGSLLPPKDAAALRAAAAKGEIKARLPPRRHSVLALPPVRSAWAARPRPPASREDDDCATDKRLDISLEPTRLLRSGGVIAARAHTHVETPTYSELTKRFAERHRFTPDSDTSEVTEVKLIERRTSTRLHAGRNADFSIRLDDASSKQADSSGCRIESSSDNADNSGKRSARSIIHTDKSFKKVVTSVSNFNNSYRQTERSSRHGAALSRRSDNRQTSSMDRRNLRTRRLYNPNL